MLPRPASIILSPQKWFVSSLRLQQRINLAIQPILHNTVIDLLRTNYLSNTTAAKTATHQDSRRFEKAAPIERLVVRERSNALADALVGAPASVWRETLHAPLARVFHQLRKVEDQVRKTAGQDAEQVASRVTRRLQRVEERSFAVSETVTRQVATTVEREAKMATERAVSRQPQRSSDFSSQWETNGPSDATRLGDWPQDVVRGMQIDIERIADQVMRQFDRRIVAQRERMGKI